MLSWLYHLSVITAFFFFGGGGGGEGLLGFNSLTLTLSPFIPINTQIYIEINIEILPKIVIY